MLVKVYRKISVDLERDWENFNLQHSNNSIFQSPVFFKFYEKVQNIEPFLFLAYNGEILSGVLLAILIRERKGIIGQLTARVVVYGGPLVNPDNNNESLDGLLNKINDTLKRKSVYIQFRNFFGWTENEKEVFKNFGYEFRERLNLIIPTQSLADVQNRMQSGKKRQIRKGLTSGVDIDEPHTIEDIEDLYNLLLNLYKNKVRKPLPSFSFFENFYYMTKTTNIGIIRIIRIKGKVIGGIIAPITVGKAIYEWYVVGLDKEYPDNYPSIVATWLPIDYALKNNLDQFDFMGLGRIDTPYGVRDFKMSFGGEVVNHGRFGRRNYKLLYSLIEFVYNIARLLRKV